MWNWIIAYVCCGLLTILLGDGYIRKQGLKYPVGTRVLLAAGWPLAASMVVVWFLVFCFEAFVDDDHE